MEFVISSHLSYVWKKEHLTTVLEELLWKPELGSMEALIFH